MKILFCGQTFPRAPEMLRALLPEDEVLSCPGSEVQHVGLTVDALVPLMHRLEGELIQRTSARVIQQWGVGLEGVDIPAATARGIPVCNVPADETANADSTAEHALFLMLGVARRVHECLRSFAGSRWGTPTGEALCGKTALIVGLGRVGAALASKLRALGMNVEAIRRTADPERENALRLRRAGTFEDLGRMASDADFVISCVALTDETRGLFDAKLFRAMKKDAAVINVSRGPVVEENDLIRALKDGRIAGAGLDVFSQEPVAPGNPLLAMDNVFATPHVAGATRQTYEGVARIVHENMLRLKAGRKLLHCVNGPG
jgi:phosphoglycerate dehydrogenase-like enzyme